MTVILKIEIRTSHLKKQSINKLMQLVFSASTTLYCLATVPLNNFMGTLYINLLLGKCIVVNEIYRYIDIQVIYMGTCELNAGVTHYSVYDGNRLMFPE